MAATKNFHRRIAYVEVLSGCTTPLELAARVCLVVGRVARVEEGDSRRERGNSLVRYESSDQMLVCWPHSGQRPDNPFKR